MTALFIIHGGIVKKFLFIVVLLVMLLGVASQAEASSPPIILQTGEYVRVFCTTHPVTVYFENLGEAVYAYCVWARDGGGSVATEGESIVYLYPGESVLLLCNLGEFEVFQPGREMLDVTCR